MKALLCVLFMLGASVASAQGPYTAAHGFVYGRAYYGGYGYSTYGYGGYDPLYLRNRYSLYGGYYSNYSWRNPYSYNAPRIYDRGGVYRGRLSTNQYDPDSISNPYGRYGNRFSPDSLNNQFGAGNPYGDGSEVYVVPEE